MDFGTRLLAFARPPLLPVRRAAAALCLGLLVYLAARDRLPELAPAWLAAQPTLQALRSWIPDGLLGQLPSFVHAYAIVMLGVAVAGATGLARAATIGGTALCLGLEAVQHPAVAARFTGALGSYATHGTFDSLDIVAIVLAAGTVTLQTGTALDAPIFKAWSR